MHCHYEFHLEMGMVALFIVEDGQTANTSLPSPPANFQAYGNANNLMPDKYNLQSEQM
jgi:laccase